MYRSGAIAVTLDTRGRGSVMDPTGKCLMVISDEKNKGLVAKVLDKRGNCTESYDQFGTYRRTSPIKGKDAIDNINEDDAKSSNSSPVGKGKPTEKASNIWRHEGLHIEFNPSSWELKVDMKTELYACTFSSISGIQVTPTSGNSHGNSNSNGIGSPSRARAVRGDPTVRDGYVRPANRNKSTAVASSDRPSKPRLHGMDSSDQESDTEGLSNRVSNGDRTGVDHDTVRMGVQSVISQLDDILSGIKGRR
jgi:hypothetical protein